MKGKALILSLFLSFLFVSLISCNQQETLSIAIALEQKQFVSQMH